jgi:geranylgeranylglycerol-phosphate geranylgeranyltransferase
MNTLAIEQYPVLSFRFLKAYIITMRPYLMFVSGVTGIAGMSFSAEMDIVKAMLIFFASFLSYGFGQALTDCFQIDTDSISSPYRPLTQGIVNRNYFLVISCLGLLFCISILTYFNPLNILLGTLSGIGLITYTYFKRKWWAGPFYNSWIVLVLFMMAYLAGLGSTHLDFSNLIFIAAIITVFFGYANFVLTGYFKDIEADRATAYNTLPVVFGRKISSIVSDAFGFIVSTSVFVLIIILAFDSFPFQTIIKALVFIYTGICVSIFTQINLHSVKSDAESHIAIAPCVHSYILLLSGIAILTKPDWFIYLLMFYILYIITLKLRPARSQI